jgi:hypothetical protein
MLPKHNFGVPVLGMIVERSGKGEGIEQSHSAVIGPIRHNVVGQRRGATVRGDEIKFAAKNIM